MRLIDADKLPATCNVSIVNGKLEVNGWIAAKRIEEAPTVEAVPIEWVKRYAKKGGRIANILFPFEIEMMLEDWEKENANDKEKEV